MKDEKDNYEPPKAMRLTSLDAGAGYGCDPMGSGDTGYCKEPGNSASGDGCRAEGNSPSCTIGSYFIP